MSNEVYREEILTALKDLIHCRAERGNAQSKHGPRAAAQHELWKLTEALDKLMGAEEQ